LRANATGVGIAMVARKPTTPAARRTRKSVQPQQVHQFLVALSQTDPLVWRRIQVPESYSFWDLHVAIQDAMGWLDTHLHEFVLRDPRTGREQRFGIPDEDFPDERPILPDCKVRVSDYVTEEAPLVVYVYDFGDDWRHTLTYEGTWPAEPGRTYPACLAGARACPPEDVGGVHGFAEFLKAIADPKHPEHAEDLAWVGGSYRAEVFEPEQVKVDDPKERLKRAFEVGGTP
jgi:Plasmid pRiA4b ORF-3-like protein